jgi:hypothetical protein
MNHNTEQLPPVELTPVEQDTRRLDWLDSKGGDWIARDSEYGRGYRLHQTTRDNSYPTARMAIDAAMHDEKYNKCHASETN